MQADYSLCCGIVRACHDASPNALHFADLCRKYPDRTDANMCYHLEILQYEGFLEIRKLRSASGAQTLEAVQFVHLSHPVAAEHFLNPPAGEAAD